ncbi:MAG: tRNA (adenosine(37)-N6)-threonylcarbamoyltransferase complex dimerization subunit type 1 TsaB [Chloroflexota bacterium]
MLLAIDTATRTLSLALHDGQQIQAEMTWETGNQHTVELLPAIQQMFIRQKIMATDLTLLAVSQGPGSFNGLRIGFSTAKGLALSLAIPLIAIPTLDVIAAAQPSADHTLLAVVQAGRGRVCAGSYQWGVGRWIAQNDTKIAAWQTILDSIEGETTISGEIDAEGRAAIEQALSVGKPLHVASPAYALRRAGFLADLAWQRWHDSPGDEALTAVPLYLHQPGVPHP